jgi:ABC-type lipoprotein export system ATPase subunit
LWKLTVSVSDQGALTLSGVRVVFAQGRGGSVVAVDAGHLAVDQGTLMGISGPSGSGKTTLLHVLAGLQTPTEGRVRWGAQELVGMSEDSRDAWRRQHVGFVFQDFHLVPELTARENVLLPLWFARWSVGANAFARATALLEEVGVPDPDRRASVLSRGEQQRVAIARALLPGPRLILADEPTASLDAETGAVVADLLVRSAKAAGATLILVSHDPAMLARVQVVRRMDKGVLLA